MSLTRSGARAEPFFAFRCMLVPVIALFLVRGFHRSEFVYSAVAAARRPLFVTIDFSKLWEDVLDSINEWLFFPLQQRPRRIKQFGLGAVPRLHQRALQHRGLHLPDPLQVGLSISGSFRQSKDLCVRSVSRE